MINKELFICCIAITFSTTFYSEAISQDCGTEPPTEQYYQSIPWYGDEDETSNYTLDRMYDSLIAIYSPSSTNLRSVDNVVLRIPLKFWLYRIGPGNPGGNPNRPIPDELGLQRAVDRLNNSFRDNNISMRFFVHSITPVDDEDGIIMDSFQERQEYADEFIGNSTAQVLNVHVVDGDKSVYQYGSNAIFVERRGFLPINSVNLSGRSTLTHEIGHYFGLLHTFNFSNVLCFREPVSRGLKWSACPPLILSKRCVFTGDLLCDTDADPNMSENGNYTSNCTWSWNGTDAYGDTYHPNLDNYMAYNSLNDPCRTNFTSGQKKWMMVWAFTERATVVPGWLPGANDEFDIYEPDNEAIAARTILPGETQEHTFHKKGRMDVDWVVFTAPACGLTKPVTFKVTNQTSNAVDEVAFFERNTNNGSEGAELTATENNGTFTLSSANLVPGREYLIRITKATDNSSYKLEFPFVNSCISGSEAVCSSSTIFSIPTRPSGSTITWSKSSNLTYVSGQGSNNYTVKAGTSGSGWIEASITKNGSTFVLPRLNLWVGKPKSLGGSISGSASVAVGDERIYQLDNENTYANDGHYDWTIPTRYPCAPGDTNCTQIISGGDTQDNIRIKWGNNAISGNLTVKKINGCGSGPATSQYITISGLPKGCPTCPTPQLVLNPNPVEDDLNMSITNLAELEAFYSTNELVYQVDILSITGEKTYHGVLNKNGLKVNLKHAQPGMYTVVVQNKDFSESYNLYIQ